MGSPAARLGDPTVHGGTIIAGFPTVLIGGQPASRIGDMHACPMVTVVVPHVGGPLIMGSFTVWTGGVPQSRVGDMLICIGPPDVVAMGCPTVFVGMSGGGLGFGAMLSGLMAGLENFGAGVVAGIENLIFPPSPSPPLPQLLHAREMAGLASDVYQKSGAPPGWTRLSDNPSNLPFRLREFPFHDPRSGFDAALYQNNETGKIVLAYRGTEPTHVNDWETNLQQVAGFQSAQYDEAVELAQHVKGSYLGHSIEITGHSLGGGLAQVGSATTGYPATTFNAAGVNDDTFASYDTLRSDVRAQNYTVQGELLSSAQSALPIPQASGEQITLEARNANGSLLPVNPIGRHGMDSVQQSLDYAIGQDQ
jgi:uncharacterized Zn-binding protein involved in type VI secretion